jgi:hypothetical protein
MSKDKAPPTKPWSVRLSVEEQEAFDALAAACLISRKELLTRLLKKRVALRSYPATAALGHVIATLAAIRANGADPALSELLTDQIKILSRLVMKELT